MTDLSGYPEEPFARAITPQTPHFSWLSTDQIACPFTGLVRISRRFLLHLEKLEELRGWYRAPIKVILGYIVGPEQALDHPFHLLSSYDPKGKDDFATDIVPSLQSHVVPPRGDLLVAVDLVGQRARRLGFSVGLYQDHLCLWLPDPGQEPAWQEHRTAPPPA